VQHVAQEKVCVRLFSRKIDWVSLRVSPLFPQPISQVQFIQAVKDCASASNGSLAGALNWTPAGDQEAAK